MDLDLHSIAATGASTLVGLMTTEAWGVAKSAFASLFGRNRPEAVTEVSAELELDYRRVQEARAAADGSAEESVRSYWNDRLSRLLALRPDAAADLAALLERLGPVAAAPAQTFHINAKGNARVYTAGRDMRIGGDR
jgi:hypothetical protein